MYIYLFLENCDFFSVLLCVICIIKLFYDHEHEFNKNITKLYGKKVIYIVLENNFNYGILKLVIVECFLNPFFVSYNNCMDRHDYHLVCIAALCDVMAYVYQEVY